MGDDEPRDPFLEDLKCIVLERLYTWHASKDGRLPLPPNEWPAPPDA